MAVDAAKSNLSQELSTAAKRSKIKNAEGSTSFNDSLTSQAKQRGGSLFQKASSSQRQRFESPPKDAKMNSLTRARTLFFSQQQRKRDEEVTEDVVADFRVNISREQAFTFKFQGVPVENSEIFKSIPAYSPSGRPKQLPATPENLERYGMYLRSLKKYSEQSKEKALDRQRTRGQYLKYIDSKNSTQKGSQATSAISEFGSSKKQQKRMKSRNSGVMEIKEETEHSFSSNSINSKSRSDETPSIVTDSVTESVTFSSKQSCSSPKLSSSKTNQSSDVQKPKISINSITETPSEITVKEQLDKLDPLPPAKILKPSSFKPPHQQLTMKRAGTHVLKDGSVPQTKKFSSDIILEKQSKSEPEGKLQFLQFKADMHYEKKQTMIASKGSNQSFADDLLSHSIQEQIAEEKKMTDVASYKPRKSIRLEESPLTSLARMQTQLQQEKKKTALKEMTAFKGFFVTKTEYSEKTPEPVLTEEQKAELEAKQKKENILRIAREKVQQDLRHQHRVKLKIRVIEPPADMIPSKKGQIEKEQEITLSPKQTLISKKFTTRPSHRLAVTCGSQLTEGAMTSSFQKRPAPTILEQSPTPKSSAKKGRKVKLMASKGKKLREAMISIEQVLSTTENTSSTVLSSSTREGRSSVPQTSEGGRKKIAIQLYRNSQQDHLVTESGGQIDSNRYSQEILNPTITDFTSTPEGGSNPQPQFTAIQSLSLHPSQTGLGGQYQTLQPSQEKKRRPKSYKMVNLKKANDFQTQGQAQSVENLSDALNLVTVSLCDKNSTSRETTTNRYLPQTKTGVFSFSNSSKSFEDLEEDGCILASSKVFESSFKTATGLASNKSSRQRLHLYRSGSQRARKLRNADNMTIMSSLVGSPRMQHSTLVPSRFCNQRPQTSVPFRKTKPMSPTEFLKGSRIESITPVRGDATVRASYNSSQPTGTSRRRQKPRHFNNQTQTQTQHQLAALLKKQ